MTITLALAFGGILACVLMLAAALTYRSPNTVKSYIRTIYRKIEVGSRTQTVLWGVKHGFTPDHHRIQHWRGSP